jgi:hypothetical protein
MTTRKQRRRARDAYLDDLNIAADGEVVRVPHYLADSAGASNWLARPPVIRYGRGYCVDAASGLILDQRNGGNQSPFKVGAVPTSYYEDLPRGEAFPTQSGGTFPAYNNEIGAACECANGKAGTLQPHPSTSSMLICVENSRDAAYWYAKDAMCRNGSVTARAGIRAARAARPIRKAWFPAISTPSSLGLAASARATSAWTMRSVLATFITAAVLPTVATPPSSIRANMALKAVLAALTVRVA